MATTYIAHTYKCLACNRLFHVNRPNEGFELDKEGVLMPKKGFRVQLIGYHKCDKNRTGVGELQEIKSVTRCD